MLIRPRRDADLPACADIVLDTHVADGYPHFPPGDPVRMLSRPGAFGYWVAEHDGAVAGHVALVAARPEATTEHAAQALGLRVDELAVVSRLFVSPKARGLRAGRLLLDAATAEAHARSRWPVLDVAVELAPAIRLYESAGWTRAGKLTVELGGDRRLTEYVYLGPPPAAPARAGGR